MGRVLHGPSAPGCVDRNHLQYVVPSVSAVSMVLIPLLVRGAQYAKAVSSRQNAAMEDAARITLDTLQADRRRGYY